MGETIPHQIYRNVILYVLMDSSFWFGAIDGPLYVSRGAGLYLNLY